MNQFFPHLFSPIEIGGVHFKNRLFCAPTTSHGIQDGGRQLTEAFMAHYVNKAKGGAAQVTVGGMNVERIRSYDGLHAQFCLSDLENAYTCRDYIELSNRIHFYGAVASLELLYMGHVEYTRPQLEELEAQGRKFYQVVGGTRPDGYTYDTMPVEEMERIAELYADAAAGAKKAGFDMALIHGGHGTFLEEFLSPLYNTRTDEYGGAPLENRARFPIMVLDAVRRKAGRQMLVEYRVSGSERVAGGLETDEVIAFLEMLGDRIDIAHISAGTVRDQSTRAIMHPSGFLPPAPNAYLAKAVKESGRVKVPVLTLGAIYSPDVAERILAAGEADIVSTARGMIADPELGNKARAGRAEEIRPCIKCFRCLDDYKDNFYYSCSVNPEVGMEHSLGRLVTPAQRRKKVAVIGGGPAGMGTAIGAARRGHEVTLFEKGGQLGGALNFSDFAGFKYDLRAYRDYLVRMTEKQPNIHVELSVEATPESVAAMGFDTVVAALGSAPVIPPIPGVDGDNVCPALQVYGAELPAGTAVAVVGGGQVGCETALYLAQSGMNVTLVEQQEKLAPDAMHTYRIPLMQQLEPAVRILMGCRCTAIDADGLTLEDKGGKTQRVAAGLVVIAAGMAAKRAEALAYQDCAEEFHIVGDAQLAKNVWHCTKTAFFAANQI